MGHMELDKILQKAQDIFNKKSEEVIVADTVAGLKLLNVKLDGRPRITALEVIKFSGQNNDEVMLKALGDFIRKNNLRHKNIILLPHLNSLIIKRIQLPAIPAQELPGAIKWHLKAEVPFDLSGAAIDFSVVKDGQKEDGSKVLDCLCVIAAQEEIVPNVMLLKQLGLCCLAVVPRVFGYTQLIRHFSLQDKLGAIAVLHAEEENSSLSIHKGNKLEFYRELPLSIGKLKESLKGALISDKGKVELSDEEAAEALFKVGVPKEGDSYKDKLGYQQILSMLRPALERLAQEIARSLAYYTSQFHEAAVNNVLVAGELSLVPNIEEFLSRELSLSFKKLALTDKAIIPPGINAEGLAPSYAAFGAALGHGHNINLLPYEFACEKIESFQKVSLRWAAFIALLLLVFFYIFARVGVAAYQKRLDNAILHLNILSEVEQAKSRIEQADNFISGMKAVNPPLAAVLKKLSNIAPKEIYFSALSLNYESRFGSISATAKGDGINPDIILKKFTGDMENSGYFTDVAISSLQKERLKDSDIARFNISFKLR